MTLIAFVIVMIIAMTELGYRLRDKGDKGA